LGGKNGNHAHVEDFGAGKNEKHAHVIYFQEVKMENMRMLRIFWQV
jgi:hypothetical protein